MEVMGLTDGVYLVPRIVGLLVPVGVKLQIGIVKFIAGLTVSVLRLLAAMIFCLGTEKRFAILWSVSFSLTV